MAEPRTLSPQKAMAAVGPWGSVGDTFSLGPRRSLQQLRTHRSGQGLGLCRSRSAHRADRVVNTGVARPGPDPGSAPGAWLLGDDNSASRSPYCPLGSSGATLGRGSGCEDCVG